MASLSILALQTTTGWFLGLMDSVFHLLRLLPFRPKFFREGWGRDLQAVYGKQEELLNDLQRNGGADCCLRANKIEWEDPTLMQGGVSLRKGTFRSPCADLLPPSSKYCQFYEVSPNSSHQHETKQRNGDDRAHHHDDDDDDEPRVYVILLPATGEMGKRARLETAKYLATTHGWCSLIVTAPFYASRKPASQRLFFLDTVSDLQLQSLAVMFEAATLATHFLSSYAGSYVCISGFSWGGAMSACATTLALLGAGAGGDGGSIRDDDRNLPLQDRIACVPYVGSASPAVLVDGILEQSIDWNMLKGDGREQLWREFYKTQLTTLSSRLPDAAVRKAALCHAVVATHDQFITQRYVDEFLVQLSTMSHQVSTQRLPGGHITAMLARPWVQRNAIVAAIKELTMGKLVSSSKLKAF